MSYALGNAKGVYEGKLTRALRHVIKLDASTFVLVDDLAAPSPATFSWLVHSLDQMELDTEKPGFGLSHGQAACRIDLACDAGLKLSQHNKFDPPPIRDTTISTRGKPNRPDHWHARADTVEKRPECFILARLNVTKKGEPLPPVKDEQYIDNAGYAIATWKQGSMSAAVMVRRDKPGVPALKFDEYNLAGKAGIVVQQRGRLNRYMMVEGTSLRNEGESLAEADQPLSVSLTRLENKTHVGLGPGKPGMTVVLKIIGNSPRGKVAFRARGETVWEPLEVRAKKGRLTIKHPGKDGEIAF